MTHTPLRIAILGCGAITRSEHLPTVIAHPGVHLVGLVDTDTDRARSLAKSRRYDCQVAGDYRSLLGQIDAVINALPNRTHAPVTLECLKNGVHVLCEKPLATSSADARACAEAAQQNKVVLAVGMNRRFVASHALLRLILDEGSLGSLKDYDCQYGGAFDWKSTSGFYFSRELAGGGALIDFGVHLLDSVIDWFGEVVRFDYQDDNWGSGIEANAIVELQHVGRYGPVKGRMKISRTYALGNRLLVRGSDAEAEIPLHRADTVEVRRCISSNKISATLRFDSEKSEGSFYKQLSNFVASIEGTAVPETDGWQAVRVLQLIEGCYAHAKRIPEPWSEVEPSSEWVCA